MRNLWVLLVFAISPFVFAESSFVINPQQCVWHVGDNPAWTASNLDESGWQPLAQFVGKTAHGWVRCRADLASLKTDTDPALQVTVDAAYELFVNGQLLGKFGSLATGDRSMDCIRSYPLPARFFNGVPATIALRFTSRPINGRDPCSPLSFRTGDAASLDAIRARELLAGVRPILAYVVLYCIVGIIGLLQLGHFYYDRTRRDLLWISIYCFLLAVLRVNALLSAARFNYPLQTENAIWIIGNFAFIFEILFFFALARRRVPWLVWVSFAVCQFMDVMHVIAWFSTPEFAWKLRSTTPVELANISGWAWTVCSLAPFAAFWPWTRQPARLRPLMLCCFLWGAADVLYFFVQDWNSRLYGDYSAQLIAVRAVCSCASILALLWLLFRDQRRITEERAVLVGEFQAARQIQTMLAPTQIPTIHGVVIEVAFRPMSEVGGDFYLCRVISGGRQRLLIGDVSGKGAAAAMTAALLIGGAEDHDDYTPGQLLGHLDRVLRESQVGGFATCLCADFAPNGRIILANAGHLPPYRRGLEILVEPSLPLGLSGHNSDYTELEISADPGDTLTFLSDGVVEARSPTGELFGFGRAAAISRESAEKVAEAAQAFGQEDDITVLTLTFSATHTLQGAASSASVSLRSF